MALHRGRATSRGTGEISIYGRNASAFAVWLCFCLLCPFTYGLYSTSDQVVLLTPENVQSVLVNSTAAIVAEFYASWCGHCIAFSPVYKSLARDIKGWYVNLLRIASTQRWRVKNNLHLTRTVFKFISTVYMSALSWFYSDAEGVFQDSLPPIFVSFVNNKTTEPYFHPSVN